MIKTKLAIAPSPSLPSGSRHFEVASPRGPIAEVSAELCGRSRADVVAALVDRMTSHPLESSRCGQGACCSVCNGCKNHDSDSGTDS